MSLGGETHTGSVRGATTPFAVECPGCRANLAATPALAGGPAACPFCQTEFLVPPAVAVEAAAAPVAFAEPPLPSTRRRPDDAFVLVEADAGELAASEPTAEADPLVFHEPVTTIARGTTDVAIHRLTAADKRTQRAWRTLLILVAGVALLVTLAVFLATGGR